MHETRRYREVRGEDDGQGGRKLTEGFIREKRGFIREKRGLIREKRGFIGKMLSEF